MFRLRMLAGITLCSATLAMSGMTVSAGPIHVISPAARLQPPMAVPPLLGPLHYMHTRETQPVIPNACCELFYAGGPVLLTPHMYVVLWGFKAAGDPDNVAALLTKFSNHIGGSKWNNIDTQYYSSSGGSKTFIANPKHEGSVWDDEVDPEPLHASDSDVRTETAAAVNHFGYDANGAYLIVSSYHHDPQGFLSSGWCAYHQATSVNGKVASYTNLPYMPDGGTSCGAASIAPPGDESSIDEGVTIVAGHEFAESVTDPRPFSGWSSSSGEIGDLCAWQDIQNDKFGKFFYTMQPLYSNASQSCVHSY